MIALSGALLWSSGIASGARMQILWFDSFCVSGLKLWCSIYLQIVLSVGLTVSVSTFN